MQRQKKLHIQPCNTKKVSIRLDRQKVHIEKLGFLSRHMEFTCSLCVCVGFPGYSSYHPKNLVLRLIGGTQFCPDVTIM